MLEDLLDAQTEFGCEVAEDDVWEGFAHWLGLLPEIVPHDSVLYPEVYRRSNWHMRDDQPIRLPAMLMQQHQIGDSLIEGDVRELLKQEGSAVESDRVRENNTHLFGELEKPRTGVA